MNIIGKTEDGFVLTASSDEVANLIGYHGNYSTGFCRPKPGDVIKVAEMYKHLYNLGDQKKEIADMASKLRTAADLIDTLPDPISAAKASPDGQCQR